MGFYLLTMQEQQKRKDDAQSVFALSAQYGGGYLPSVTCADHNSAGCRHFSIHTPSKAIADRITQTLGTDYQSVISAQEISDAVAAVLDTFIQQKLNDFLQ